MAELLRREILDPEVAAKRNPHGTAARYTLGHCHCFPYRVTKATYETERNAKLRRPWRLRYSGDAAGRQLVDAGPTWDLLRCVLAIQPCRSMRTASPLRPHAE
jgi:hypothetical protein